MKMFQYVVISKGRPKEIWVCEQCRKKYAGQSFDGNWRLIDKCISESMECAKCDAGHTVIEDQLG
ncbi:MAG: hypothetical protein BM485_06850 [Desulfobulbaceae bacterium DB1]|nr:MAG: hypothetical protein BM485_06850 [Desulfobulbaceae bacterium DB1]